MAYQLVTCPETARLEMIEYEDSPLGMLIVECSRFRPPCGPTCPRTCAARLDERERERAPEPEPEPGPGSEEDDATLLELVVVRRGWTR